MAKQYLIVTVTERDFGSYESCEAYALILEKEYLVSYKQGTTPTSIGLLEQMKQDGFGIDPSYFNNFVSKDLKDLSEQLPRHFSIKITEIKKIKGNKGI